MAPQQGMIRVQQHEHTVTFQPEGHATMHHSPAVRRFAEQVTVQLGSASQG